MWSISYPLFIGWLVNTTGVGISRRMTNADEAKFRSLLQLIKGMLLGEQARFRHTSVCLAVVKYDPKGRLLNFTNNTGGFNSIFQFMLTILSTIHVASE